MSVKDKIAAAAAARAQGSAEAVQLCGEWVDVREMSLGQRSRVMDVGYTKGARPTVVYERFYPALLTACVYDAASGQPVFGPGDEELINSLGAEDVDRIAAIALRLSGMDAEGVAGAKNASGEASAA
ncbi:MAG: hypothetical protein JWM27_4734 [Gemmatimonadetes bacterium]|nr:hypothetical protein [Gemmatimonadota bacterium]